MQITVPETTRELWAQTTLKLWPERYWMIALPFAEIGWAAAQVASAGDGFAALLRDQREITLTLPEAAWRALEPEGRHTGAQGPLRVLSFDIVFESAVVGYLAPAAARLAAAGVSIVPQCAYALDHLLLREEDLNAARAALEALIAEARAA